MNVEKNSNTAGAMILTAHEEHPACPGVYLFKDAKGRILYAGKAKNLRKRLASYFRKPEHLASKTRMMMAKAASVDVLCTTTEKEALLLESSLIKKHRPRYNICLRDDKQYVLFKLDVETEYPRLALTRKVLRDKALYFGPFTSAQAARQTLKAVHSLFPLRRCKDSVFRNRVRPCLYHHMGQCLGPCVLEVSKQDYADMVRRVRLFLSGRSRELAAHLKTAMQAHAQRLEYEKAAEMRDLLHGVTQTLERQGAVLQDGLDRDVVGIVRDEQSLGVSVLFVRQGRLLDSKQFRWLQVDSDELPVAGGPQETARDDESALDEDELRETLDSFLVQFYGPEQYIPEHIVLPVALANPHVAEVLAERRGARVQLYVPRSKDEKRLMEMARANAGQAVQSKEPDVLQSLAKVLGAPKSMPRSTPESLTRIEVVDVSHLAGRGTVAGMVVFEHGRPKKSAYRLYSFPELEGSGDDCLALAGWAERRVASGPPWPDLLLVDGGLGQLNAVGRALEQAGIGDPWLMAGIVKAGRRAGELEDRIFVPGRKNPLPIKPGSPELLFLQHLRDTAHRFAIIRQRQRRTKTSLDSRLAGLTGVGPKTARLLWEHFPNIEAMRSASVNDLAALPGVGAKRAARLHELLQGL